MMATAQDPQKPTRRNDEQAEATAARIRDLNEQLLERAKALGSAFLDAHELALQGMIQLQDRPTRATALEWVSALARMQADYVQHVTEAHVRAMAQLD
jgi:hypothetical protein